jgi:hypothetical protein
MIWPPLPAAAFYLALIRGTRLGGPALAIAAPSRRLCSAIPPNRTWQIHSSPIFRHSRPHCLVLAGGRLRNASSGPALGPGHPVRESSPRAA